MMPVKEVTNMSDIGPQLVFQYGAKSVDIHTPPSVPTLTLSSLSPSRTLRRYVSYSPASAVR